MLEPLRVQRRQPTAVEHFVQAHRDAHQPPEAPGTGLPIRLHVHPLVGHHAHTSNGQRGGGFQHRALSVHRLQGRRVCSRPFEHVHTQHTIAVGSRDHLSHHPVGQQAQRQHSGPRGQQLAAHIGKAWHLAPAVLHQHRHDFKRHQVALQSALQVLHLRLGHLSGLRRQAAAKLPLAVHHPQG